MKLVISRIMNETSADTHLAKALDVGTEFIKTDIATQEYMHQAVFMDAENFGVKKFDEKVAKIVYRQEGTRTEAILTIFGALKPQHNPAKNGCLCRVAPASERQARDTLGRTNARGARY
ncbi:hypothetical protein B0H17DRAFT_1123655 [Mycena rosella]|uniref:Uncharacterized protein n=1 Tax=Mycena rosella TaxID=1033263 RepID=A0AAD7H259_MYCRO|nr:hypothetical protein B0H17DRAFT_1123655 [Mycena rosella]